LGEENPEIVFTISKSLKFSHLVILIALAELLG